MNATKQKWVYGLALAVCLAALLWYTRDSIEALLEGPASGPPVAPLVETKPSEQRPLYPLEPPSPDTPDEEQEEPEILPPLEASDSFVREILIEVFSGDIDELLTNDELAYKIVATADNLTTPKPSRKIWPVQTRLTYFAVVPAEFPADLPAKLAGDIAADLPADLPADISAAADSIATYYPSPNNYQRYNALVKLATRVDPAALAATYRRIYPLLQESYISLGYPEGYFNDRLVEVIDHLLSTPEPTEPLLLVRPRILYEYADPELEALSGSQKLMLRMGPDNAGAIKQTLREFRQQIIAAPTAN